MAELTSEGFLKVPHASAQSAALPRVRSQSDVENDRVLALISRASASAPPALAIYLKQAAPAIALMWKFVNLVAPLYAMMWAVCVRVYETLPVELLEALMGLGMCFAGGAYCTSIAAIEAFRLTGWHTTRRALQDVYAEAKNIQAAHAADDKKDDDHDGKPDVLALAADELLQRKVKVFALAVRRATRCHAHPTPRHATPTPRPRHVHSTPHRLVPRRCQGGGGRRGSDAARRARTPRAERGTRVGRDRSRTRIRWWRRWAACTRRGSLCRARCACSTPRRSRSA